MSQPLSCSPNPSRRPRDTLKGLVETALRERYREHGRSQAVHWIMSEASIGKAYLKDFGIVHFKNRITRYSE